MLEVKEMKQKIGLQQEEKDFSSEGDQKKRLEDLKRNEKQQKVSL